MMEYNWSEDWEAENRLMGEANQWDELRHVIEGYWEDEDESDDLDERR